MNGSAEDRERRSDKLDAKTEERFKRDQIEKESGGSVHEEYAAEIVPQAAVSRPERGRADESADAAETESRPAAVSSYRWLGYTALLLSIVSLFIYPALLGTTSALLGFFAYSLGYRALGAWSVAIGLISLVGYLFLVPLYA